MSNFHKAFPVFSFFLLSLLGCSVSKQTKVSLVKKSFLNNDTTRLTEYYILKNYREPLDQEAFDSIAIWSGLKKAVQYKYLANQYYIRLITRSLHQSSVANGNGKLPHERDRKIFEYIFVNGVFTHRINYFSGDTLYNSVKEVKIIKKPIDIQFD